MENSEHENKKDALLYTLHNKQFKKGESLVDIMRPLQMAENLKTLEACKTAESKLYYTPDITDIRIGYECEINQENINPNFRWAPYIVGEGYENITIARALSEVQWQGIRVPYLTKEQIEAEGWKFSHRFEGGSEDRYQENYKKNFSNGYYSLSVNQFQFVTIHLWNCIDPKKPISQTHWRGILPSINELRYICKLLGINQDNATDKDKQEDKQ